MANSNHPQQHCVPSTCRYTLCEFGADFPDDAACLDWLVGLQHPNGIECPTCGSETKHHRLRTRAAYACQSCGHHTYPMKGTIFEGSATPLRVWFRAIYLMTHASGDISAKELQRRLGVTYKTAWRMHGRIRRLVSRFEEARGSN